MDAITVLSFCTVSTLACQRLTLRREDFSLPTRIVGSCVNDSDTGTSFSVFCPLLHPYDEIQLTFSSTNPLQCNIINGTVCY